GVEVGRAGGGGGKEGGRGDYGVHLTGGAIEDVGAPTDRRLARAVEEQIDGEVVLEDADAGRGAHRLAQPPDDLVPGRIQGGQDAPLGGATLLAEIIPPALGVFPPLDVGPPGGA